MRKIHLQKKDAIPEEKVVSEILEGFSQNMVKDKNVLIVCEDITRSTPVHIFFPELSNFLLDSAKKVTVLFALGTHRQMTKVEMKKKLGVDTKTLEKLSLKNHNVFDKGNLIKVGELEDIPLKINKAVRENDLVITIGSVIPHRVMGFSGGGKILCPGIGNKEMIDYSHWKSNDYKEGNIVGKIQNPMRELMDKQVDLIKEKFPHTKFRAISFVSIPNTVFGVFIDDIKCSYYTAAKLSKKIFFKKVEECNSILTIVDKKCVDFWQAAKAVYNCARVIKTGGKIVVMGSMPEGISGTHEEDIKKFGYSSPEKIRSLYKEGKLTNQVAASHMIRVSEHLEKIDIILSSKNLDEKICNEVNLDYARLKDVKEEEYDYVVYNPVDLVLTT